MSKVLRDPPIISSGNKGVCVYKQMKITWVCTYCKYWNGQCNCGNWRTLPPPKTRILAQKRPLFKHEITPGQKIDQD